MGPNDGYASHLDWVGGMATVTTSKEALASPAGDESVAQPTPIPAGEVSKLVVSQPKRTSAWLT
ncbi:unnamed protein product [Protopolystoma xenopodis]|uniref:Uncharacterized protein n=1 Tax=Protopolystoma xenopodis TaxID=117903 RepID=A0A448WPB6_9PLAT|nr:unnamed protein product [Protopolystoma xenopodis]